MFFFFSYFPWQTLNIFRCYFSSLNVTAIATAAAVIVVCRFVSIIAIVVVFFFVLFLWLLLFIIVVTISCFCYNVHSYHNLCWLFAAIILQFFCYILFFVYFLYFHYFVDIFCATTFCNNNIKQQGVEKNMKLFFSKKLCSF